jgi:hypothetical protein
MPFENILDRLTGSDPSVTDYVQEVPARCLQVSNVMTRIYIDADGCPVKNEVYRVAERYKLPVLLVANKRLNLSVNSLLEMVVVTGTFDAADDWIVEKSKPNDIIKTGTPVFLFSTHVGGAVQQATTQHQYAVSNNSTRFLMNNIVEGPAPPISCF